jgi:hypothetical protein
MALPVQSDTHLAVHGLSLVDYREISSGIESECEFTTDQKKGGAHGDLASGIVLLALTPSAMTALVVVLLRKTKRRTVTIKFEKVEPNGKRETVVIELDEASAEAPTASVIRSIATALKIDVAKLLPAEG